MMQAERIKQEVGTPARISYYFMAGILVLIVSLHLATPLLAALFAYLALAKLHVFKVGGKAAAVLILLALLSGAAYGLGYFIRQAAESLPEIANKAIPAVIQWAQKYHIELPFTDYDSLKDMVLDSVKGEAYYLSGFAKAARGATAQLLFLVVGCVVAISLFLDSRFDLTVKPLANSPNLYSRFGEEIAARFGTLYRSFVTVMGAQIVIAAINTVLTAIFTLAVHLPYGVVVVGVTFLCGLVPVVGNLVSNTIIVGIGFTVSPQMAFGALVFLVAIHKLEYFLNSKIVGWRIRNPLWLTLLGLVVGERLMGVAGMILAPVILHYVKVEMTKIEVGR